MKSDMKKSSKINSQTLIDNRMALMNTKNKIRKNDSRERKKIINENDEWDIKCQITKIMDANNVKNIDLNHNNHID